MPLISVNTEAESDYGQRAGNNPSREKEMLDPGKYCSQVKGLSAERRQRFLFGWATAQTLQIRLADQILPQLALRVSAPHRAARILAPPGAGTKEKS